MTPIERFMEKVDRSGSCWLWTGAIKSGGYGNFWSGASYVRAHRFSYEMYVGPIPEGAVLDHLCRVRRCVRPDHLEPVSRRENTLRGETIPARNAAKVSCKNGHVDWAVRRTGDRWCRTCDRHRKIRLREAVL